MSLPRILCVDDEPSILRGLQSFLRRSFEVTTAPSAEAALELMAQRPPFEVVLSDKDMPGMNGIAFLAKVRDLAPDTVRVMFTGKGDLDSAAAAIEQGQIFRFLLKPAEPDVILACCQAAVKQHALLTSERVLLEQTLRGSIEALTQILAIASPQAFGRGGRLRRLTAEIERGSGAEPQWQVEVAAMLSQIGAIALPPSLAEKMYEGAELDASEQTMVDKMPELSEAWLTKIPRLEEVRTILRCQNQRYDGGVLPGGPRGDDLPRGARLLKLAGDYDRLLSQNLSPGAAVEVLRKRVGWYDPKLLETLASLQGAHQAEGVREIFLGQAEPGMIFAADVRTRSGALLIAKGFELTPGLLQRMLNLGTGAVQEPVKVRLPG